MPKDSLLEAFAAVDAGGASAEALTDEEFRRGLYPLPSQARSFAPERVLVVGGRGTGKTEVFRALLSEEGRAAVVRATGVPLSHDIGQMVLVEAFGAGKALRPKAPAHPAADALESVLRDGDIGMARRLWLGLSLGRLWHEKSSRLPLSPQLEADLDALGHIVTSPRQIVRWTEEDIERPFALLDRLDIEVRERGLLCVFMFDALDRAANSWSVLETAVAGLLSLALDVRRRSHALSLKVFLRPDLESSGARSFPDASKLRGYREDLTWDRLNLYRLLFKVAANARLDEAARATRAFLAAHAGPKAFQDDPWLGFTPTPRCDEAAETRVLNELVGPYMGADRRRGRSYVWVPNHLQDAHGRVSPRSFLVAWAEAARDRLSERDRSAERSSRPFTPSALAEGVRAASSIRVHELTEDFPWIEEVAQRLEGLEVPCPATKILERLRKCRFGDGERRRGLHREAPPSVLQQLVELGVFFEQGDRYNVPDLYRVAMKMKRRGGIKLAR